MPLPLSGAITLQQIINEFGVGGNPKNLQSYLRNGSYCTSSDYLPNLPWNGTAIKLTDFYGAFKCTAEPYLAPVVISGKNITFSGTAVPGSTVKIYTALSPAYVFYLATTTTADGAGNFSVGYTYSAEGIYRAHATATKAPLGESQAGLNSIRGPYYIDTSAPTVTSYTGGSLEWPFTSSKVLTCQISDYGRARLYRSGVLEQISGWSVGATNIDFTVALNYGHNFFSYAAEDTNGNISAQTPQVDTGRDLEVAPTVSLANPGTINETLTFNMNVTVNKACTIYVQDAGSTNRGILTVGGAGTFAVSVTVPSYASYTFHADAIAANTHPGVSWTQTVLVQAGGGTAITVTITPNYLFGEDIGRVEAGCNISATGGSGAYSYAWTKLSGSTVSIQNATTANPIFWATFGTNGGGALATYRCTVTGSASGSGYADVTVDLVGDPYDPADCVIPGTLILIGSGAEVPVESLKVGDIILTRPENDPSRFVPAEITVARLGRNTTVTVEFEDGRTVSCSQNHRLFADGYWLEARQLRAGMLVAGVKSLVNNVVKSVIPRSPAETVVKLTVKDAATYISNGVLSHNMKP